MFITDTQSLSNSENKSNENKKINKKTKKHFDKKTSCKKPKKRSIKRRKYQRKLKVCFYDSDDYNNSDSEKRENLSKWDSEERDEDTGFMIKVLLYNSTLSENFCIYRCIQRYTMCIF